MHIGKNVVRYVSNSSWSRTITNKNTYWTFIIFNFETVITFFYFWTLSLTFGFFYWFFQYYTVFKFCILLTVFQQFDELALSLCRRAFRSFQKQCCSYINKPTTYRWYHQCCLQKTVKNSWKQQNLWKISLNELHFNKNAVLHHATFIKTTDHRPTDHFHWPTDPPTTYPPTHRPVVINLR